jgi:hypothetical protein
MQRTFVGFCVGAVGGVVALAAWGAWGGYAHGHEWVAAPAGVPGRAAVRWALVFVAYCWWLAGAIGGCIGALAGLGSWLARPVASPKSLPGARG